MGIWGYIRAWGLGLGLGFRVQGVGFWFLRFRV